MPTKLDALLTDNLGTGLLMLTELTEEWKRLGRPLDQGRALLDLAKASAASSKDPRPNPGKGDRGV